MHTQRPRRPAQAAQSDMEWSGALAQFERYEAQQQRQQEMQEHYRLLSVDQGWETMTVLPAMLTPHQGLLEFYLSHPFSVTGPHEARHVMNHPEYCGMLVGQAMHDSLLRYSDPASPFWPFQLREWQVEHPVSELLLEAACPPRADNCALLAALGASLTQLFPRATLNQCVRRDTVMRHFQIPVGHGRAASKQGSIETVRRMIDQGVLQLSSPGAESARQLLLHCDHVCDALLQALYHWGHWAHRIIVHAPMRDVPFEPIPMRTARFAPPPSWRPV